MNICKILYAVTVSAALVISGAAIGQTKFTQAQVKQIQNIIHSYIVRNPGVLVEASHALQQQEQAASRKTAIAGIVKYADKIFDSTDKPIAGNPNGTITLVEFFDYQCPHCKAMAPTVKALIKSNPSLKVIFADWPIFGADSQFAAKAAIASMSQNKYPPFHDALINRGYPLNNQEVLAIAKQVGLNLDKLQQEMKAPRIDRLLKENALIAKALKIIGTPAFIIGNTKTEKYDYLDGQTSQAFLQKIINSVR